MARKCTHVFKDGTQCAGKPLVGSDRCYHHQRRVELSQDEYQKLLNRLEEAEKERTQLRELFNRLEAQTKEVVAEGMRENPPPDLSEEDLAKARRVAEREALKRVQRYRTQLHVIAKEQFEGPKYAFTPDLDDVIPIGGVRYKFAAGVPKRYPLIAIDAYKNRRRQLAHRETLKGEMGATPAGEAVAGISYGKMQRILQREMGNV